MAVELKDNQKPIIWSHLKLGASDYRPRPDIPEPEKPQMFASLEEELKFFLLKTVGVEKPDKTTLAVIADIQEQIDRRDSILAGAVI